MSSCDGLVCTEHPMEIKKSHFMQVNYSAVAAKLLGTNDPDAKYLAYLLLSLIGICEEILSIKITANFVDSRVCACHIDRVIVDIELLLKENRARAKEFQSSLELTQKDEK